VKIVGLYFVLYCYYYGDHVRYSIPLIKFTSIHSPLPDSNRHRMILVVSSIKFTSIYRGRTMKASEAITVPRRDVYYTDEEERVIRGHKRRRCHETSERAPPTCDHPYASRHMQQGCIVQPIPRDKQKESEEYEFFLGQKASRFRAQNPYRDHDV
jgi:hypothetical protein